MSTITVRGAAELVEALERLGMAVSGDDLTKALLAGGYVLEGKVKIDMAQAKSGRMYGGHQASAAGESPAMDSGVLAASVMTEAQGERVFVGTNSEYAEPLEFGTARMAARPFMGPAAANNQAEIEQAVRAVLKALVDGAANV